MLKIYQLSVVFVISLLMLFLFSDSGQTWADENVENFQSHENACSHTEHADNEHDHADHSEEHGHEEEHEGHHAEDVIRLDPESRSLIGIQTIKTQMGSLDKTLRLTGRIRLNEDNVAHVVPYVPGVVQRVTKRLGDSVQSGEMMAVIHSRELSEAKAAYLASLQRYELSNSIFQREEKLWQQKISSEQEFMQAKIDYAEAKINKMLSEQKLLALGFNQSAIEKVLAEPQDQFMKYTIAAPFDGVVIDKHITLGEVVKEDAAVFTVANLESVWIDLDVFPKDIALITEGQMCYITSEGQNIVGEISFLSPVLNPDTRTATARIIADNAKGLLKPGLFVTAEVYQQLESGHIVLPQEAVQTVHDEKCVFLQNGDEYLLKHVTVGLSNATHIEIRSGLEVGESVVTKGAFDLKAKIVTSTLDSHAGHGH